MQNFKQNFVAKILSWVLSIVMVVTLLPVSVFAADEAGTKPANNVVENDGSSPAKAIDATGTDPNAKQIYRGKAWIENEPDFDEFNKNDKPIEGMTVYLQWMNTRGIVSPIYKTTTKSDGTYIFDLSKPVDLVTGKTASFKPSEGQNFLVRTWVKNPDPSKYSVVKNGDMFSGGYHHRLKRKQENWDFTVGIERIVNANIQLEERPNVENWLAKPENDWVRANTADGIWQDNGSAGVASGRIWYEVGELAGGSPNEYLYDKNKGDLLVPGMEVVASYVNDDVARAFDQWKKDNKGYTLEQFKQAQKDIITKYDAENGTGSAIAETVVGKTDANGDYRIPFRGLYGVSRDKQNPPAAISNKVSNEEYGTLVEDADLDNKDTRKWDGIVNLKARHINYDYMYVYPIVEEAREVWMKMFENNMFQTMNSIGGVLLAGQNMKNIQFALLAPRPIHDVTNYDTTKNFASVGDKAESKTTGLVPNNTYQVQWFKDGKPVGEPTTMTANANGEFGSVPITVEEPLDKPAVYTSAVFPGEGSTKNLGDALYSDSFVADPTPGVKLHRNLTEADKNGTEEEVFETVKVKDIKDKTVELPKLHDTDEYKVDEATNKYFVGWSTDKDATEPDKNELVTEEDVKADPKKDLYVRDGSEYKVQPKKVTDLYAVWKEPFKVTAKKTWKGAEASDYDTSKLKFGLLYRPALGAYGEEVVKSLATYKPYYKTDADIKDYSAEGMIWENLPSYNVDGKRYTYILAELSNENMLEAFKKGSTDWDTYQINIVEGEQAENKGKKQTVYVAKNGATEDKLDAFSSATVRKHVKDGQPVDKVGYFETEGYDITATNKKFDIKPPVVEKANEGDTKVTISHEEKGIEEFKGTMKVAGKETKFSAKRNPADNTWTITDENGQPISGVTVDNSNPSDNTLVLNTPTLQDGDFVNAKAVRRDVASPEDVMNVAGKKAKLPTDIKQEYSENPDNAVITAKPAMTTDEKGDVTGLANPDAEYSLVDQEGNVVSGPVKANGEEIKFDVPKKELDENKEYSIKVSLPGKEDNNTNTVDDKPSTDGTPSNKSVKVDITAPKVTDDKLPDINGKVGDTLNKSVEVTEPNGPVKVKSSTTPTGVEVESKDGKLNVTGSINAPVNEEYKAVVEDKFGNSAEVKGTIKALPKVTQSIPEGADSNLYSKITFKADENSTLRDKNDGDNYVLYVLKDFDQDGTPDTSISLSNLEEAGFTTPNYDINEGYKFDKWDGMELNLDTSKDTVVTLKTKFDVNSLKDPEVTPVKDTGALTQEEKEAVKEAIKKANPNLPENATIVVDDNGKTTVKVDEDSKEFAPEKTVIVEEGLKAPEKTSVKDPKNLTEEEKNAVKEAIKKANPNLPTDTEITVDNEGNVTVKDKNGKELGTFKPEETISSLNAPEKTSVKNPKNLTEDEKSAVKEAIKKANPELPTDAIIEVANDGSVTVKDKDGKEIGSFTPEDTIAQTDADKYEAKATQVINKAFGEKTLPAEVNAAVTTNYPADSEKQPTNAIKENPPTGDKPGEFEVPVSVEYPDKTYDTVNVKVVVAPRNPDATKVENPEALTEDEKAAVKKAIEDKNTDLPEGTTIKVDDKGEATVTYPGGSEVTIPASVTVDSEGKLNPPAKTQVKDKNNLTDEEKDKVKAAVKEANPSLPTDATIEVANDGSVTVKDKDGKEIGKLEAKDTIEKEPTIDKPVAGDTTVSGTGEPGEKITVTFPDGKTAEVIVGADGKWTAPVPEGTTLNASEEVKANQNGKEVSETVLDNKTGKSAIPEINPIKSDDTEITGTGVPGAKVYVKVPGVDEPIVAEVGEDKTWTAPLPKGTELSDGTIVKVTQKEPNKAISDEATKSANKSADPTINPVKPEDTAITGTGVPGATVEVKVGDETLTATVDDSGKWSVEPKSKLTEGTEIKATQTEPNKGVSDEATGKVSEKLKINDFAKTPVENLDELTAAEKKAVKDEIIKANPDLTEEDINVDDKGNTTITKDGQTLNLTPDKTVYKNKELKLNDPQKTPVKDLKHLTDEEKEAVKEAVRKANPDLDEEATVTVLDNGFVEVKSGDKEGTIDESKTVKSLINDPEKTKVVDPNKLTEEEKEAVKDAVKKANPSLTDDQITVDDKGNVTVTVDGEKTTIPAEKTITSGLNNPTKTIVEDSSYLTDAEKKEVEDAIRKANPNLPEDATIEVAKDGTVTVKNKDGEVIGTIPGTDTVRENSTAPIFEKSARPIINGVFDTDEYVTGLGVPGATIIVRFPDGNTVETIVDRDGRWEVEVPGYLEEGDRIEARQIEPGKEMSEEDTALVRYDERFDYNYPRYDRNDRYEREETKPEVKPDKKAEMPRVWTPDGLNSVDHYSYIKGYTDGTFGPQKQITRAEVATIFARLSLNKAYVGAQQFKDIKANDWYKKAIDIVSKQGIVNGYEDGSFKPNKPITRREFAAMISRYAGNVDAWKMFKDVPATDWAYKAINRVAGLGWINGYEDGTFRPNNNITRAEVVAIVNRMLNRVADKAEVEMLQHNNTINFTDNLTSAWYYYDVYEAAIGHDYTRQSDGRQEKWNNLNGKSFELN